jgi:hypothetical protein
MDPEDRESLGGLAAASAARDGLVRIACGAGFAGDRLTPAVDLVRSGRIDVLVLECLAERTLALAQQRMRVEGSVGYDLMLERRLRLILPESTARGVSVVTNAGAADPLGAGEMAKRVANELGLDITVAVVTGDDVLAALNLDARAIEDGEAIGSHGVVISANAYLGAAPIIAALEQGADLVITGRVADAALFLGPILHGLGATLDDRALVAAGLIAGHLLECGAQVSGGYFADGVSKNVPRLAEVGFPIAEVALDGEIVLTKLDGTGGTISRATVTEQLLYEVLDPLQYLTPDGAVDMTAVFVVDEGNDRVRVWSSLPAAPAPETLKVSVGYEAGFYAEAEISYMGSGSRSAADLAAAVLRQRLAGVGPLAIELLEGILDDARGAAVPCTRVRVAARLDSLDGAEQVSQEVSSLYTNGPAGGSSLRTAVQPSVGIISTLLLSGAVTPAVTVVPRVHARLAS